MSAGATVRVRGNATAEEVAAVLTALSRRAAAEGPSAYERWRRLRLATVIATSRPAE